MMKIDKRKRNYHVREKILMLIDNWQETFGPGSRYPQYYAAFHSLSRAGVVFPRRSDRRAPVFAPAQSESYNLSLQSHDHQATELPDDTDFPTLSMSEIQNARSIVDVLAEMLNGVEPGKEESVKQNVIIGLVQQCRTYKQRVLLHLINSTTDESLLSEGLALNDNLQKLLAKHETIASGTSAEADTKPPPLQALIDIDEPAATIAAGAAISEDSSSKAPAMMSPSETVAATAKSKGKNKSEKIGEKAKCLQELMPWEKKLKMATLLEEACKYVKFLQAQIISMLITIWKIL